MTTSRGPNAWREPGGDRPRTAMEHSDLSVASCCADTEAQIQAMAVRGGAHQPSMRLGGARKKSARTFSITSVKSGA